MMKKRIVFAVTNDLTYDRRMFRICAALAEAGMDVLLIGRKRRHSKGFNPNTFQGRRFSCWFNKGPLFYAEYNIRLFCILMGTSYEIACACDLDTAPAIRLASRLKRRKTVYDAHEYFSEVPELSHRPIVKSVWEWIGRKTIPAFDACYTVGEELAKLMGRKYNVHFEVIRNIAPSGYTHLSEKDKDKDQKMLLYQGALNVGRGLEACIQAIALLPDWHFWLAGEGDITLKLKQQVASLGLEARVHFLGWVRPDELPALMQKAKLSINLREKGSMNDYYSLPNKFFDAIHAGLPSINMNYPEYVNICRKYPCSILLDEVDAQKIANAIHQVDHHPELWSAMAAACKQAAEEYNWTNESSKLVRIYTGLLQS
jgi:glycosyltransferase involved in cell wall biosynthesis